MGIVYFVAIALQIIILICFFILCSNVSKIKKSLFVAHKSEPVIRLLLACNKKEAAADLLMKTIANDEVFIVAFDHADKAYRERCQKSLEERYKVYLDALDIKLDYAVVNELISKSKVD